MANHTVKATEYLQEYWETYTEQDGWHAYSLKTVIDDALFGIGAAISDDYYSAEGFDKFKADLAEYLKSGDTSVFIGNEPRGGK